MKIIGIPDTTIQTIVFKLKGVDYSFPEDYRSSEVLICQDYNAYKKFSFEIRQKQLKYKVLIFLDYIKQLKNIYKIQIIEDISDSFIRYIKEKCTFDFPYVKLMSDTIIEDKIKEVEEGSFFSKIITPLLYNGIKNSSMRKDITKSVALSILECIKKQTPQIVKYKEDIKRKYLKLFLEWLETDEAKKVCECLLTRTVKYNFDDFEINYLINVIQGV